MNHNQPTQNQPTQNQPTEPRTVSPLAPVGGSNGSTTAEGAPAALITDPVAFAEKVAKVIEVIRPAIQADDGDIELRNVDVETGVVTVELLGACVTCPISTGTLKDGVERILKARVEGVTAVQHVGETLHPAETGTRVSL